MNKTLLLSLNPINYKPILYGIKKYEYRTRFCKEEVTAYLYLSSPIKQVVGILELGKPLLLSSLMGVLEDKTVINRINNYISNYKDSYAIPIKSLRLFKTPITLEEIRQAFKGFMPPQSYYILDNKKELLEYLNKSIMGDYEIINKHDNIYEDNIAVTCNEMKQTKEYKLKDENKLL